MSLGVFYMLERSKLMTEESQTVETTEKPKAEPQAELEQPKPNQDASPASDEPEGEWDQQRAMDTIHKLREIEKQSKKDAKELARLKAEEQKRIEAQMTEQERLQKERDELASKAAKLEADILRRDVIAETGLPSQLADRLRGDSREDLVADALELLKLLPKTKSTQSVTNPGGASSDETEAQMRERLYQKSEHPFDIKAIKAKGGGVFWDK
jgi:hypothetical protein